MNRHGIVSAGFDVGFTTGVSLAVAVTDNGTFSLAPGNNPGRGLILKTFGSGTELWSSASQGGTGTITITTITANHVTGTLALDAAPNTTGATGTIHVSNGRSDIQYQ